MTRRLILIGFFALVSSSAWAGGLLVYKEQGFHTDLQAKLVEYATAEVIPQSATVILKTGNRLDLPAGRSPVLLPFPDVPVEKPVEVIKLIDSAMARFPQHTARLETLKKEWLATISKTAQEKPKENESGPIFVTRNGTKFSGVSDIKSQPNGLVITHNEGVTKVSFYNLTDEQIKQYGLTRHAADDFTEQQKESRKLSLQTQEQKFLGQLQQKALAEIEKTNGFNSSGRAIQVTPELGILYRGYRVEEFIDIEKHVEDCLANQSTDPRYPKRMVDVKVKKQRSIPIGDEDTNLSFVECDTGDISDGDKIDARLYKIGTFAYSPPLGETRRIPRFTTSFEKFYAYYSGQK